MTTIDIPLPDALTKALAQPQCIDIDLPKPKMRELHLPTGGTLKGLADVTRGIPTDCSMNFSLMLQLAPIMASMECLLKLLKFVGVIISVFNDLKSGNPFAIPAGLGKIVDASEEVMPCIGMAVGAGIPLFIKDLLALIARLLRCTLQSLKSLIEMMDGIELDLSTALQNGNDERVAALNCAKTNAMNTAEGTLSSLEPIMVLISLAEPFFGIVGQPSISIPAVSAGGGLDGLKSIVQTLEPVAAALEAVAGAGS